MPVSSSPRGCLLWPPAPTGDAWFGFQARVHPRLVFQQSVMGRERPAPQHENGVECPGARGPEASIDFGTPQSASNLTWERVGTPHCCFEHDEETHEYRTLLRPRATSATEVRSWSRSSSECADSTSTKRRSQLAWGCRREGVGAFITCSLSPPPPPICSRLPSGSRPMA